jgi:hypothetical protein
VVVIVRAFPVPVESLSRLSTLPSVDELRPAWCPACRHAAGSHSRGLGIVGHGCYRRQVAGVVDEARDLVVWIRRYLCRGCAKTISVLPDELYPRRWYAATTILFALTLWILAGVSAQEIRRRLAADGDTPGWKTLGRWQRQLFAPLWSWLGARVGARPGRAEPRRGAWLRRLLALHGASSRDPTREEVVGVARLLGTATAHAGTLGRQLRRDPGEPIAGP